MHYKATSQVVRGSLLSSGNHNTKPHKQTAQPLPWKLLWASLSCTHPYKDTFPAPRVRNCPFPSSNYSWDSLALLVLLPPVKKEASPVTLPGALPSCHSVVRDPGSSSLRFFGLRVDGGRAYTMTDWKYSSLLFLTDASHPGYSLDTPCPCYCQIHNTHKNK